MKHYKLKEENKQNLLTREKKTKQVRNFSVDKRLYIKASRKCNRTKKIRSSRSKVTTTTLTIEKRESNANESKSLNRENKRMNNSGSEVNTRNSHWKKKSRMRKGEKSTSKRGRKRIRRQQTHKQTKIKKQQHNTHDSSYVILFKTVITAKSWASWWKEETRDKMESRSGEFQRLYFSWFLE